MTTNFVQINNVLQPDVSSERTGIDQLRGGVVAIGNFDGVHKGHQVVLNMAATLAAQDNPGQQGFVMTFEPHPRTVFRPDNPVFRLTPGAIKARLFNALGLNGICIVPFDKDFSQMSADAFVKDLLIDRLNVSHVVVGYDFHFGKGREGSPEYLMAMGKTYGFGVTIIPAQKDDHGELIFSSSQTRSFLAQGKIAEANAILGYRYFVSGEIIHGEKRGRDLGYPTANMALAPESELKFGIYAVRMRVDGKLHDGVASFGRRPTFDNGAPLLETFLFDFKGDLYGKTVEVIFESYLREEMKFDDLDSLIRQMDHDSENARSVLNAATEDSVIDVALNNS